MAQCTRLLALKRLIISAIGAAAWGCLFFFWGPPGWGALMNRGGPGARVVALGRLAGLLAEAGVLLQIFLIGRIPFIEQAFGHDKLNRWHQYNGFTLSAFLILHPLLIILGHAVWSQTGFWGQAWTLVTVWDGVWEAFIAWVIFATIIIASVRMFLHRRYRYETWYLIHLSVYAAIILVLEHQTNFGDFAGNPAAKFAWQSITWGAFGLLVLFRFIRPLWNLNRFKFRIDRIVREAPDVHSIYITGRNLAAFRYRPGQFANLFFLQKGMLFAHPFSFSLPPGGSEIRFTIRGAGDFTSRINKLEAETRVVIDGPLGVFTREIAQTDKFLLIAGGIGITPIRAMIEPLAAAGADVILLYANRTEHDIVFKEELLALQRRHPFKLYFFLEQHQSSHEPGRIDGGHIKEYVSDYRERDIYFCGPAAMTEAIRHIVSGLGVAPARIHFEKFGY